MSSKYKIRRDPSFIPASNVINFLKFKKDNCMGSVDEILYLSNKGAWLSLIQSLSPTSVRLVKSATSLQIALEAGSAGLILIESDLTWAKALDLSSQIQNNHDIPIVLISPHIARAQFLKKAYSKGISDVLFAPLRKEEVIEVFSVLLKFQRKLSVLN